jgi:hypothetical protein
LSEASEGELAAEKTNRERRGMPLRRGPPEKRSNVEVTHICSQALLRATNARLASLRVAATSGACWGALGADDQDEPFHSKRVFRCLGQCLRPVRVGIDPIMVAAVVIVEARCVKEHGDRFAPWDIIGPGDAV